MSSAGTFSAVPARAFCEKRVGRFVLCRPSKTFCEKRVETRQQQAGFELFEQRLAMSEAAAARTATGAAASAGALALEAQAQVGILLSVLAEAQPDQIPVMFGASIRSGCIHSVFNRPHGLVPPT